MQTTPRTRTAFLSFYLGLSHSLGAFQRSHFTLTHDLALYLKQLTATFVAFYTIKLPGLAFSIQLFIPSNFIIKLLDECRLSVTVMHRRKNISLNLNLPPSLSH